jgi:hypothetical protein
MGFFFNLVREMKFNEDRQRTIDTYKNQWSPQQVERVILYEYYQKIKGKRFYIPVCHESPALIHCKSSKSLQVTEIAERRQLSAVEISAASLSECPSWPLLRDFAQAAVQQRTSRSLCLYLSI